MNGNNILAPILFFTAVGFALGMLLTWFLSNRRGSGGGNRTEAQQRGQGGRLREELGLWRAKAGNRLHIWIGGRLVENVQHLSSSERQQVEDSIEGIRAWLDESEPDGAIGPGEEPDWQRRLAEATSPTGPAQAQGKLPATQARNMPLTSKPGAMETSKEPPGPGGSIVNQINEILQDSIAGTPLEMHGIRLSEDFRDGVVVWVGSVRYNGVESVSDPQIKAALRAAAAEWERRQEAGRRK